MAKACVGYCRNRTLAGEDLFLLDPTFNINFTGATQCNQLLLVTLNNILALNHTSQLNKCFVT